MGKVVANLDNVGAVVPILENLGKTHAHFKVRCSMAWLTCTWRCHTFNHLIEECIKPWTSGISALLVTPHRIHFMFVLQRLEVLCQGSPIYVDESVVQPAVSDLAIYE
jgi:hypothetical protein